MSQLIVTLLVHEFFHGLVDREGLGSLYGSTTIVNDFNVKNAVYKDSQDVGSYIDPSLTNAVAPSITAAP